jgi:hypothetical protein
VGQNEDEYFVFSTKILQITTDPTQYQTWLASYVPAPAVPPAIAFSGIEYGGGTYAEIGYQPIFWEPIVVSGGTVTIASSDKSESAIIPLTVSGSELTTNNPPVGGVIHFTDTNSSPNPSVTFSSSYSGTNLLGQTVSLTAAQQSALGSSGFLALIDPNNSQVDWNFGTHYFPSSRYLDPLAGFNATVTENVQVSDPAGGSDNSTVTLNITGAPSVTELAELSANAYQVKYYTVSRFSTPAAPYYDRETLADGFSATASLSTDGTQMVIAFRGTDFDGNAKNKNLLADSSFANGSPNAQFTSYVNDALAGC